MKTISFFFRIAAAILVLALLGFTTYAVTKKVNACTCQPSKNVGVDQGWLYQKLDLSPSERARLEELDAAYQHQRKEQRQAFDTQIRALADQIGRSDELTPEIEAAIHQLHRIHGDLQLGAIEHLFDQLRELPADKKAHLRELAVQTLSRPE